jgi:hypothetical protein
MSPGRRIARWRPIGEGAGSMPTAQATVRVLAGLVLALLILASGTADASNRCPEPQQLPELHVYTQGVSCAVADEQLMPYYEAPSESPAEAVERRLATEAHTRRFRLVGRPYDDFRGCAGSPAATGCFTWYCAVATRFVVYRHYDQNQYWIACRRRSYTVEIRLGLRPFDLH